MTTEPASPRAVTSPMMWAAPHKLVPVEPPDAAGKNASGRDARGVRHPISTIDQFRDKRRLAAGAPNALDQGRRPGHSANLLVGKVAVEHRPLRVRQTKPRGEAATPDIAPECRGGATSSSPSHDPSRHRVFLPRHLSEDQFGDVVVAPQIGGALGEGELVHVVAAERGGQARAFSIHFCWAVHEVALASIEGNLGDLLRGGGTRHNGDEAQAKHAARQDSGTAVDPLDASTLVVFGPIQPLHNP